MLPRYSGSTTNVEAIPPQPSNRDVRSDLFHRRHEIDNVVLVQLNERQGDERLTDRTDAKVRVAGDRRLTLAIGITESPEPFDSFHGDERDACTRDSGLRQHAAGRGLEVVERVRAGIGIGR
jgi:hypothetical protein